MAQHHLNNNSHIKIGYTHAVAGRPRSLSLP